MHNYILLTLFTLATLLCCNVVATQPEEISNLFKKEKVTELQIYLQDILSTQPATTISVAAANSTATSPTIFGLLAVLDDPIRTAPSPDAAIIGRAQGFFAYSSLEEISIHMSFNLVFTGGKYNGSALSLVGHNPYLRDTRELPVVGGTGAFRFARGIALVKTVSFDATTGDAFFQYNVTVLHYTSRTS